MVPVADVPPGKRFICELHVVPSETDELGFDDYRFEVKERRFIL
jgi:hypothetical protein